MLRGEIETTTGTHFSFLSGLEKLRIPRARVSAAVWLKPPGKDTATARTYFTTFTGIGPDHAGVYIDTLARKGDRWLLSSRIVQANWLSPNRPA